MKNPLTPDGIEPATFRCVAQHLNHCATAAPLKEIINRLYLRSSGMLGRVEWQFLSDVSGHIFGPSFIAQQSWFFTLEDGTDSWSLKIGPISCPETSVRNYHYMLRNTPEECRSRLLRGRIFKSRKSYINKAKQPACRKVLVEEFLVTASRLI